MDDIALRKSSRSSIKDVHYAPDLQVVKTRG